MKRDYDRTPLTGNEKLEITPIPEHPALRECVLVLTAFAAEANKCTPELQAVMAMCLNKAAQPPFLVKELLSTDR